LSTRRFFVDHCVPESVAKHLESEGHDVIRLRERTSTDSPDALVATLAEAAEAILVTADKDFKDMVKRHAIGKQKFSTLSLLRFEKCRESQNRLCP
jgi:predicted nuclease of predicted toxin-antitoxin system